MENNSNDQSVYRNITRKGPSVLSAVLWLVFFFPVGVWKMWRHQRFTLRIRQIVTGLFVVLCVVSCLRSPPEGSKAPEVSYQESFEPFDARMSAFTPGKVAWVEGLGKLIGRNGTPVKVIGKNSTQYKIRLESGEEGWIAQDNITSRTPAADLSDTSSGDKKKAQEIYHEIRDLLRVGREMNTYRNNRHLLKECGEMMRKSQEKARRLLSQSKQLPVQFHSLQTAAMQLELCVSCSPSSSEQHCAFVERDLTDAQDAAVVEVK